MKRALALLKLLAFFAKALCVSHAQVVAALMTVKPHIAPGLVRFEVQTRSNFGRLVVAHFITLTPGTIALDYEKNQTTLLVHTLFKIDFQELQHLDRLVGEVFS